MGKGEYQIMENLIKYEMEMVVNYNSGEHRKQARQRMAKINSNNS